MIHKGKIITSSLLSNIPGLVHGFSTRSWGDMRMFNKREIFIHSLVLNNHELYFVEQVHGDGINSIDESTDLSTVSYGDAGIFYQRGQKIRKIILTVQFADCVPLLLVDPITRCLGVAHAGWKGTVLHISKKVVQNMVILGVDPKNILVFMGSHIGACCYSIDAQRANVFHHAFDGNDRVIVSKKNKFYADLGYANIFDLQSSGILPTHIDFDSLCTSCHHDVRYSFRRDSEATYGKMMGVIAWK